MVGALRWVWLAGALVLAVPGWASEASLTVIARELEAGQVGGVRVRVKGDRPTAPPRIPVTPRNGLNLAFEGQSQRVNIVNSKVSRFYEYTYRVEALMPGTYRLGPAEIEVGTTKLTTDAAEIIVRPRQGSSDEVLQVNAGFSVGQAWAGQVVVYRRGLRSRYQVMQDNWTDPPLEGLIPPRDGDPTYTEYVLRDPGGDVFVKEEFHPKVVVKPGEREVPAAVARVVLAVPDGGSRSPFSIGRRKTEVMLTEPSTLSVTELPPPPPGFSGLVGDFTIDGDLDRTQAAVGESVNLHVVIRGDGTLEGFSLPKPDDLTAARIYDGSPAASATVGADGYRAEGVFDRVFVPTQPGELAVPPLEILSFSPSRREYVTQKIDLPPIVVRKGKGTGAATFESFADTDSDGDTDAVYVEAPYEGVRDVRKAGAANAWWLGTYLPWTLGLAVAPLVALGGVEAVAMVGRLWAARRRRTPVQREITPKQRLARLPTDPQERLAELDAALRHALARRVGVPVQNLDRSTHLAQLDDELATQVRQLTERVDRARFGGSGGEGLERAITDLVARLERR